MNWTTEYPTKPGYYWLRNLKFQFGPDRPRQFNPEPQIIELVETYQAYGLEINFPGNEVGLDSRHLISAECFGPIDPPE